MLQGRYHSTKLPKVRPLHKKFQRRGAAPQAQSNDRQRLPNPTTENERLILDHLLEGCQIIGFDWRYLYVNDSAARHAQRAKTDLLGYTILECYPGFEKTPLFTLLEGCMQERKAATIEHEFTYEGGTTAWFELRVEPVAMGIMLLSLDITARKRTEASERAHADWSHLAFEATSLGKWQHTIATDVIQVDEQARRHYGFASHTVTLDMVLQQLHPDDCERLAAEIAATLQPESDGRYVTEYRVIHPDGAIHWLAVQAQVYFAGEGRRRQPTVWFGTSQDITARKTAEQAQQQYAQRLEILHKIDLGILNAHSISEIMTTALHQIRTFFGCQQAGALIFDDKAQEMLLFASDVAAPSAVELGARYPLTAAFLAEFGARQISVIDDLTLLPASNPAYQRVKREGMRSSLRALLLLQGQPLGVLILNANTRGYFTADQQAIAVEIANQLAIAIKQSQLAEELARHVQTMEEMQQFLQATLDGFPAHTAVLDPQGTIITVNHPWKAFADKHQMLSQQYYIGTNYLTVCDRVVGPARADAAAAAAGIRAVIAGNQDDFYLSYTCHSGSHEKWFMLRVTPFAEPAPRRVVAAHIDITERKIAENAEHEQRLLAEALRDSLEALTASLDVETVLQQILIYSATVIPSEAGAIILFEGDRGRVVYTRGYSAEAETFFKTNLLPLKAGIYGQEGHRAYYLAPDTQTPSHWISFPVTAWIRSSVGMPIIVRGQTIGLLTADSATPNWFQPKHVAHLQTFARYAALALENAQHVNALEQRVQARTAELQAAKERVEAILNNSTDGILLVQTDLRIAQSNNSFQNLVGGAPSDCVGQSLITFVQASDVDAVQQLIATAQVEALDRSLEIGARRLDGTVFDAELSVGLIKGDGVVCTLRNITERKRTEAILNARLAEEREFQGYLKALHEVMIELTQIDDLDRFYQQVIALGLTRLGFDRLALFLYDPTTGIAMGTYGADPQQAIVSERHVQFTPRSNSVMMRAFTNSERFYFVENVPLMTNRQIVGVGWNAATILWNGIQRLGWLVADNLVEQKPASKPQLDTLSLYGLTVGTLLAQKQAQLALQESEARYRLLAENIRDVVMRSNADAEYLYVSPSSRAVMGYAPAELIGQPMAAYLHPDDQITAIKTAVTAIEQKQTDLNQILRFRHKQGHYIWLESSLRIVYAAHTGEVIEFIGTARDISARQRAELALKESEGKYRSLIDTMRGGLILYDIDDRVTYVNDQACELLGYQRDEMIGKRAYEYVDSSAVETIKAHLAQRRRLESSSYEVMAKRKDGTTLYLLVSGSPLLDNQGAYNGCFVIAIDITVQKQAEQALRQALAKEKELGELKSRFVSMASHEFRTPLATILALTETLNAYRHKLPEEQIDQRLGKIKDQISHLKSIMEDVLLLSRIQARRVDFQPIELDLDALCREILSEFQSPNETNQRLCYTHAGEIHPVQVDQKLMRQIIGNLLSNAIKYSPTDKPVYLSLEFTAEAFIIQVRDEGIGIPAADLHHLFEPFHRATNVGAISGTGLGLVIAKEAVELHGGTIAVTSQLKQGTTCIVRIPLSL